MVLLVFAAYIAYRNYEPIKRVVLQYSKLLHINNLKNKNELLEIDSMLQYFLQSASLVNAKLKNQQKIIRQQTLRFLLNGDFTEEMKTYLSDIALHLPGPYYCVFVIEFLRESFLYESSLFSDINAQEDLLSLIQDLSDEEILLYPLFDNNNMRVPILLSLSEAQQKNEAAEMIKELLESKGVGIKRVFICFRFRRYI